MKKHQKHSLTKPHKKIVEILNDLKVNLEIEYLIDKFFVDVFLKDFNLVIEIYGDYWHANPLKYKEDDILSFPEKQYLAKEIWNRDFERINTIKNKGYSVLIFWENDINKNLDKVKNEIWKSLKLNQ